MKLKEGMLLKPKKKNFKFRWAARSFDCPSCIHVNKSFNGLFKDFSFYFSI